MLLLSRLKMLTPAKWNVVIVVHSMDGRAIFGCDMQLKP